ncbi:N-acetyltransferase [bacterium]|nr:N-acetyltransferase [bacterium]
MTLEISAVSNQQDLNKFIKLPWRIYKGDPHWVLPLIMDMKKILDRNKNPFFEHSDAELFLARKNGQVVGRIAAILNNNHNKVHDEKIGFFGFFESVDDQEVASQLLGKVVEWANSRGLTHLRGPTNFSTNDTCGLLTEGFDSSPVILMTYNPKYYLNLLETAGFTKTKNLNAYYFSGEMAIPERFGAMAKKTLQDKSITLRTINLKNFRGEVEIVKNIYNEAWQANWGFVPMTDKEIEHLAKELKPVVDPDIVFFAEVDGEPAGFSLSLPDYNQILKDIDGRLLPFGIFKLLLNRKKINRIRVITLGVRPKFQRKRGLAPIFYYETYHRGKKKGYSLAEFSWILEDNVLMNRALKSLGAKLYKKYAIYEKAL